MSASGRGPDLRLGPGDVVPIDVDNAHVPLLELAEVEQRAVFVRSRRTVDERAASGTEWSTADLVSGPTTDAVDLTAVVQRVKVSRPARSVRCDSYEADHLGSLDAGMSTLLIDPANAHDIPAIAQLTSVLGVASQITDHADRWSM